MTRGRGPTPAGLLVALLAHPERAPVLGPSEWDGLLRVARKDKVLSRLGAILAEDPTRLSTCPPAVLGMIRAARAYPGLVQARARWEVGEVLAATADLGIDFVLLKGVGYLYAGLPLAEARAFADLDLLVPEELLPPVEERLRAAGWESVHADPYDQRYYREWMHEIPPLRHWERQFEVDLHHRIVPRTSRLAPAPARLWEAAVAVAPRLRVLAPADMVLHCATHLFHDGEIRGGFRDLLDLHQLLTHFGRADPDFWYGLCERAELLGLGRPLYYALRFTREILDTSVPPGVWANATQWAPAPPVGWLMGRLVVRVLVPGDIGARVPAVAVWLLYLRAHWLRMPPALLIPHLLRKALRRFRRVPKRSGETGDDAPATPRRSVSRPS